MIGGERVWGGIQNSSALKYFGLIFQHEMKETCLI